MFIKINSPKFNTVYKINPDLESKIFLELSVEASFTTIHLYAMIIVAAHSIQIE